MYILRNNTKSRILYAREGDIYRMVRSNELIKILVLAQK